MEIQKEELKTRTNYYIKIFSPEDELELVFRAKSKKQREEIEKILSEVKNDIEYVENHTRFHFCRDFLKVIEIRTRFDLVRMKRLLADYEYELRDEIFEINKKIEKLRDTACLYRKQINDVHDLLEVQRKIREIREKEKEILSKIDSEVEELSREIKQLNKRITEANREYLQLRKQLRENEEKALERGDYENVSNERLKEYFRHLFPRSAKLVVVNKSSKHRAVLFAEVDYDNFQYVVRLALAGEDDNGEEWRHVVIDYIYPPAVKEVMHWTVEGAMARLFGIPPLAVEIAKRQGDILFIECSAAAAELQEVVDELEIRANHKVKSRKIEILKKYNVQVSDSEYATSIMMRDDMILVRLNNDAVVEHPSHQPLRLKPATYLIVPLPMRYDAD